MGNVNLTFFTKKCIPTTKGTETEQTPGRRKDNGMKSNFEKLCKWFDEQTELFTVSFMQKCVHLQKKIKMFTL